MLMLTERSIGPLFVCFAAMLTHVAYGDRVALGTFLVEMSRLDVSGHAADESFVAEVDDANLLSQLRSLTPHQQTNRLFVFEIADGTAGAVTENRNFHTAAQTPWSWHVVRLAEIVDITDVRVPTTEPRYGSLPSEIELDPVQWIASNGSLYSPVGALVTMEFGRDGRPGRVVNVSNRGVCGQGERVLIAGFSIEGAEPRRVLIRGRGPSLARFGIQEPVQDPDISVFAGAVEIGRNDNWKQGQSQAPFADLPSTWVSSLDDSEPALVLTLAPGAYTVHLRGKTTDEGVGLIEVFDVNGP